MPPCEAISVGLDRAAWVAGNAGRGERVRTWFNDPVLFRNCSFPLVRLQPVKTCLWLAAPDRQTQQAAMRSDSPRLTVSGFRCEPRPRGLVGVLSSGRPGPARAVRRLGRFPRGLRVALCGALLESLPRNPGGSRPLLGGLRMPGASYDSAAPPLRPWREGGSCRADPASLERGIGKKQAITSFFKSMPFA